MKLNKEALKKIIKEELEAVLDESALLTGYVKEKRKEFLKKLKDMGKPPRETFNSLDPHMRSVMGQSYVDGYPGLHGDLTADQAHGKELRANPYGGKIHFKFEPDYYSGSVFSGLIQIYAFNPKKGKMEFWSWYQVDNIDDELRRLAQIK